MPIKVAINGYGRIGRNILRALYESGRTKEIQIVAINDLGDANTNAHLTKYDTVHGRFPGEVSVDGDYMVVNGDRIRVLAERDPAKLPWESLGVDIVHECTGFFASKEKASAHLKGGAKKVIISAPAKNEDATLVLGVNAETYNPAKHSVVSNASCTTNGLAPTVKVLVDSFGLVKGQMTTVHSYTNSQRLLDMQSADLREARAAGMNIVPTSTGAARALKLVIPEVDGKLDGAAYRVPTPTVSIVEVVALVGKATSAQEVNDAMRKAAEGPMKGILAVSDEPLVSMDLKGSEYSSTVDALTTNVVGGDLVKVAAWYDNEWGYSCRTADLCDYLADKGL